jgi:hypothetical protein
MDLTMRWFFVTGLGKGILRKRRPCSVRNRESRRCALRFVRRSAVFGRGMFACPLLSAHSTLLNRCGLEDGCGRAQCGARGGCNLLRQTKELFRRHLNGVEHRCELRCRLPLRRCQTPDPYYPPKTANSETHGGASGFRKSMPAFGLCGGPLLAGNSKRTSLRLKTKGVIRRHRVEAVTTRSRETAGGAHATPCFSRHPLRAFLD